MSYSGKTGSAYKLPHLFSPFAHPKIHPLGLTERKFQNDFPQLSGFEWRWAEGNL